MIRLDEAALKIQNILNGVDNDVISLGLYPPTNENYFFKVETEGFHLDHNYDMAEGKNFIPVFLSSAGGNFDAVRKIKRTVQTLPITFYFPVRLKDDFFQLNDYLADVFIAQLINFGPHSGVGLCNISVPQFGEIQNIDLKQFAQWVETNYKKPIEVMEPYLSMTITLYVTTQNSGFLLGNNVDYSLSFSVTYKRAGTLGINDHGQVRLAISQNFDKFINGVTYYRWGTFYVPSLYPSVGDKAYVINDDGEMVDSGYTVQSVNGVDTETINFSQDLIWTSSGTGANNSPISQQLIDTDDYAKNVVNITNYSKSLMAYIDYNRFWNEVLERYNNQEIYRLENLKLTKKYTIGTNVKTYEFDQIVLSLNENVALGDLISFTITFGDQYIEG